MIHQVQNARPSHRAEPARSQPASYVGPGLRIRGEIAGSEDLRIDGEVAGEIRLPAHKVTVGSTGQLACNVDVNRLVVHGTAVGDFHAADLVEIGEGACVTGEIATVRLIVEDGARMRVAVDMERPKGVVRWEDWELQLTRRASKPADDDREIPFR